MQQEENKTVDIDTSGPGAEIELENDSKETETPEIETSAEETKTEVVEEQPEETKVESKEEAPKEDELAQYSESVQKRIAKLTKKWREAERQKDEALTYAKSVLTDKEKFPEGAWCKKGDWVIFARYAGSRIQIDGGEVRLLNDDEVLATIDNPEDILHQY